VSLESDYKNVVEFQIIQTNVFTILVLVLYDYVLLGFYVGYCRQQIDPSSWSDWLMTANYINFS